MNPKLKRIIKEICPDIFLRPLLRGRSAFRNRRYINASSATIFSEIYHNRSWGGKSVSGMGSDFEQTSSVRQKLPEILMAFSVRTFLDVPCGDFTWMQHALLEDDLLYIGCDIVPELIAENNARYSSVKRKFFALDLITDPLPKADLILCRDCLIHLSFKNALSALSNIRRSGSSYLLTTNYPEIKHNTDIVTGDFRAINLELAPFNFPKPLAAIPEDLFQEHKDNPNFIRQLALWHTRDIRTISIN